MKFFYLWILIIYPLGAGIPEAYTSVESRWLSQKVTGEAAITEIDLLESELNNTNTDEIYYYQKALLNLLKGQIYFDLENRDKSLYYLEKAQKHAQSSLDIKETSDSWRILADAGSYIMLQKGLTYIISHSKDVADQAEKALKLDSFNARASLIDAQGLLNAPRFFGGNKKKGLSILTDLSDRENISQTELFYVLTALTDHHEKEEEWEQALSYCSKALMIFPENRKTGEKLKKLQTELN